MIFIIQRPKTDTCLGYSSVFLTCFNRLYYQICNLSSCFQTALPIQSFTQSILRSLKKGGKSGCFHHRVIARYEATSARQLRAIFTLVMGGVSKNFLTLRLKKKQVKTGILQKFFTRLFCLAHLHKDTKFSPDYPIITPSSSVTYALTDGQFKSEIWQDIIILYFSLLNYKPITMVTKETLQTQYAKYETEALLQIIAQDSGYTELAVSVALDELKVRQVSVEEIEASQEAIINEPDAELLENYLVDIGFFEKSGIYLFWFIWIRYMTRSLVFKGAKFVTDGDTYILKAQQRRYYALMGFCFMMVAMCAGSQIGSSAWYVYFGGFFVAYIFDWLYNKDRRVRHLEEIMESGRKNFNWD
jgi:hypothetical protein